MKTAIAQRPRKTTAKEMGRAFDAWLREKGLTTERFALDIGMSYATCCKLRSGVSLPRGVTRRVIELSGKHPDCPLIQ